MTGTFALYWRGAGHFFVWSFVLYHLVGLLFAGSKISFSRKIQFMAQKKSPQGLWHVCGADEGSRTLLSSLGSWRSTDELHPHGRNIFCVCIDNTTLFPVFLVFFTISYKENVSHYLPSFTIIFLKIRCDKVWKRFHTLLFWKTNTLF